MPSIDLASLAIARIAGLTFASARSVSMRRASRRRHMSSSVSSFVNTCGRCRYCTSGKPNLCDMGNTTPYTLPGGQPRTRDASGQPLNVMGGCGVMAEYLMPAFSALDVIRLIVDCESRLVVPSLPPCNSIWQKRK